MPLKTSICCSLDVGTVRAECDKWAGTPTPLEGQQLAWARAADLEAFPMPPADVPLLPAVRAAMVAAARYAQNSRPGRGFHLQPWCRYAYAFAVDRLWLNSRVSCGTLFTEASGHLHVGCP